MSLFITNILSTIVKETRRLVKVARLGNQDTQEIYEALPYGVDSNPVKNLKAIYAETSVKGESVIVGYININQLAEVGDMRTYSTDANGNLKFYIWQKNDGTCLLGGDADNAVRFSKLKEAFDELNSKFNDLVQDYNSLKDNYIAHVHPAPGGTTSPITPTLVIQDASQSDADIDPAKIDEIKTL